MSYRSIQPPLHPVSALNPLPVMLHTLKNSIAVMGLNDPNMALIRLDVQLKAGSYFQQKPAVSQATLKLITEGVQDVSAQQIAETLDYAGAYFEAVPDRDFATFSIYFPKEAQPTILPLLEKMFTQAVFPEEKLTVLKKNMKKNLVINMEKTAYLAHAHFIAHVFGEQHPYGSSLTPENIDNLVRKDIVSFYQQRFHAGNIRLFVAGNIDDSFLHLLDNTLGNIPYKEPNKQEHYEPQRQSGQDKIIHIEKENTVQSGICIGKRLFNYTHSDWIAVSVLNTVLGGYFGSHLMTNIREDKGLTYGIYSKLTAFLQDGLFLIRADVNKNHRQQAVDEIFKELALLSYSRIPEKELRLVKNYLSGALLRHFDGIFSQTDRVALIANYNLPSDYWQHYVQTIEAVDTDTLFGLANTCLQSDSMTTVTVG
ncbi:MAG: insulinase family protein [Bacteroidales bacterium]|nr:insulinase family protein [Bacteroidales bacterium]